MPFLSPACSDNFCPCPLQEAQQPLLREPVISQMVSALFTFSAAGKSQIVKDLPRARSSVRPRGSHPWISSVFQVILGTWGNLLHLHTSAYVSICQHTSAYVSIRQHTSAPAFLKWAPLEVILRFTGVPVKEVLFCFDWSAECLAPGMESILSSRPVELYHWLRISRQRFVFSRLRFAWVSPGVVYGVDPGSALY